MELNRLYEVICERRDNPTIKSYTARLMSDGEDDILKKVGEEAMEVILAGKGQTDQRLVEEISDLVYHVMVLMAYRRITPEDIRAELKQRHQKK